MDILREMRVLYSPTRAPKSVRFTSPRDAALWLMPLMQDEIVEVAHVIYLTVRHDVIAKMEIGRGGLDSLAVDPRTILTNALLANAAAFVLAHNHPSGDPTPSADDIALTSRLKAAATMMGVDMIDHIIIGAGRYFSMKEIGGIL